MCTSTCWSTWPPWKPGREILSCASHRQPHPRKWQSALGQGGGRRVRIHRDRVRAAGDLNGLKQIREFTPRDNDSLQAGRLLLATELAKAGAFAAAEQIVDLMPSTFRDAFFAGEAVELAVAGKITEAKAAISKLPRQEQRDAAWLRVAAAAAFHKGAAAAAELLRDNDELQTLGPDAIVASASAWAASLTKPNRTRLRPLASLPRPDSHVK